MKRFSIIPHTADLHLRVVGSSKQELFVNALYGMFSAIHPVTPLCRYEHDTWICTQLPVTQPVSLTAPRIELLLVDFLSQALYYSDVYNQAFYDASFTSFADTALTGSLHGVPITGFEHGEIKAVTFHQLAVRQEDSHWITDIVFDI